jgi:hypothetical protein
MIYFQHTSRLNSESLLHCKIVHKMKECDTIPLWLLSLLGNSTRGGASTSLHGLVFRRDDPILTHPPSWFSDRSQLGASPVFRAGTADTSHAAQAQVGARKARRCFARRLWWRLRSLGSLLRRQSGRGGRRVRRGRAESGRKSAQTRSERDGALGAGGLLRGEQLTHSRGGFLTRHTYTYTYTY